MRINQIVDFQSVIDLQSSQINPQDGDKIFIKDTNYIYDYDQNSTLTPNNITIIEFIPFTGRFIAVSAVNRSEDVILTITKGYTNNYVPHTFGEDSTFITGANDKMPIYVQINERSHSFIQELISQGLEPKIRLMREPMGQRNRGVKADSNYSWTILTHNNEVTGQKQSSGGQYSANGVLMNDIETKFDLPLDLKNHVEIMIKPTDWFRRVGSTFGDPVLPIEYEKWTNDNAVRLRGRKVGKFQGRKKALRFKFCLEWTDINNSLVRLRSLPTFETLTLYPVAGWFGVGGMYPSTTKEVQKYYYTWKLDVK